MNVFLSILGLLSWVCYAHARVVPTIPTLNDFKSLACILEASFAVRAGIFIYFFSSSGRLTTRNAPFLLHFLSGG